MDIKEGFVICGTTAKEQILKENTGEFKNYIFLTLEELESRVYGSCEKRAVFALMRQYALSYELAMEYIRYIPYVEEKNYNRLKLDSLVSAKRFLKQQGLFTEDLLFFIRLRQYPVTFLNADNTLRISRLKRVLSEYTEVLDYRQERTVYCPVVYAFKDMQEEAWEICNMIFQYVRQGVSLNHIHILNMDKEYAFLFERLSKHYHLPIRFPSLQNINSLDIAKSFLAYCDTYPSFSDIMSRLDSSSAYYNTILHLIVDYGLEEENPKEYKSFFYEKFKKIPFAADQYEEMISTIPLEIYTDEDYVFFPGLNLGACPKTYKDDTYLSDAELAELGLSDSAEKNRLAKEELIRILTTTKNIFVSYKKNKSGEECLPSNLIRSLGLYAEERRARMGYNRTEDNLKLGILYTEYIKYRIKDEAIEKYDLRPLGFQKYNNRYQPIDSKLMTARFADKPLRLAYSNIKTYFACPFSYYADRILGLNEFKPAMAARLGTFSHAVLEDSYQPDFVFEESVRRNKTELAEDSKDRFYFTVMEDVLRCLIEYNRRHEEQSMLDRIEREAHIEYRENEFVFEGYIDKLLYTEIHGEIYAAIIDYKTGKDVITLDNVTDGFHLQLPSYMFLLSKYERFQGKKIHILGIYLQKVNIIVLDNTEDIVAQREKSFRLQGFSIRNRSLLSMLDPGYDKSSYIMGMSTLKNGEFSRYAKLVDEDEQQELITLVDDLIHQASKDIHQAKFAIAPKQINGKNESCMFCKYKDICYMSYEDLVELPVKPFPKRKDGDN